MSLKAFQKLSAWPWTSNSEEQSSSPEEQTHGQSFFASLLVIMLILLMSGKDEQQLLQDSRMLWPKVSNAALRSHVTICCLQRKSCKSLEAYVNSLTASDFSKANVFKIFHYWDGFIFHSPRIATGRKWRCGCDLSVWLQCCELFICETSVSLSSIFCMWWCACADCMSLWDCKYWDIFLFSPVEFHV